METDKSCGSTNQGTVIPTCASRGFFSMVSVRSVVSLFFAAREEFRNRCHRILPLTIVEREGMAGQA